MIRHVGIRIYSIIWSAGEQIGTNRWPNALSIAVRHTPGGGNALTLEF